MPFTKTSKATSLLVADPLVCVAGADIARAASGPKKLAQPSVSPNNDANNVL
jgi:hypothetical protein